MKPLPDDIERAQCQLATFLTEVEFVAADVPGRWVANTTPDYFEPRMFLITQIMDESRHLDVFRKRAFANGGGLMQRPTITTSGVVGNIDLSRDFTEMSSRLPHLRRGRRADHLPHGRADGLQRGRETHVPPRRTGRVPPRGIWRDAHAVSLGDEPDRREEVHTYLDEGERAMMAGNQNPAGGDSVTTEAMAILLGGGKNNYDEGIKKLMAIRRRQVKSTCSVFARRASASASSTGAPTPR